VGDQGGLVEMVGRVGRKSSMCDSASPSAVTDVAFSALLGLALAYLGHSADAVREGERAAALVPASRDSYVNAYMQHQLARIHLLTGQPERALDYFEPLLRIPYMLSPGSPH
jgi:hypothetical protein